MPSYEIRGISRHAQHLLDGQEDINVDFKQSPGGLDAEDLVAFANSAGGGTILLGVKEVEQPDGRQRGKVVGCQVGDTERLSIVNKAESCIPPVEIDVIIENVDATPFFRIEIPSGPQKPYCTAKGTYKIRGDGANKPLTPRRLLSLFLDSESEQFLQRFRDATEELEAQMARIQQTMNAMARLSQALNRAEPGSNGNQSPTGTDLNRRLDAVLAWIERQSDSDQPA